MWGGAFEQLAGLGDLAGQHVLVMDSELCSGTPLLVWAMQRGATHCVCLWEAPLHYQTVARKLGRALPESVTWLESLPPVLPFGEGSVVVVDSLFPLEVAGEDVVGVVRRLRTAVGRTGTLVTLAHDDSAFAARLAYEADVVVRLRALESSEATGRLAVARRGERASEMLFTVRPDSVQFTRVVA
jgi:hypothetical protein